MIQVEFWFDTNTTIAVEKVIVAYFCKLIGYGSTANCKKFVVEGDFENIKFLDNKFRLLDNKFQNKNEYGGYSLIES